MDQDKSAGIAAARRLTHERRLPAAVAALKRTLGAPAASLTGATPPPTRPVPSGLLGRLRQALPQDLPSLRPSGPPPEPSLPRSTPNASSPPVWPLQGRVPAARRRRSAAPRALQPDGDPGRWWRGHRGVLDCPRSGTRVVRR
ncbi:MAG TPA: hypothetical protein VJT72_05820 [Pseudonocardiaceae bacterium]|nr:hypothetical protein [Pseudonocardiaceae bacterium]